MVVGVFEFASNSRSPVPCKAYPSDDRMRETGWTDGPDDWYTSMIPWPMIMTKIMERTRNVYLSQRHPSSAAEEFDYIHSLQSIIGLSRY